MNPQKFVPGICTREEILSMCHVNYIRQLCLYYGAYIIIRSESKGSSLIDHRFMHSSNLAGSGWPSSDPIGEPDLSLFRVEVEAP
jgi:hypothetical protein